MPPLQWKCGVLTTGSQEKSPCPVSRRVCVCGGGGLDTLVTKLQEEGTEEGPHSTSVVVLVVILSFICRVLL